jgi:hypothetical protein
MKTAVEWLFDNLDLSGGGEAIETLNKAKEMEKEQIIEAFKQGVAYWNGDEWKLIDIEQYYNKTFNK